MINRNTDTIKEIKEAYKAQQITDIVENPIPVVNVNPKAFRENTVVISGAAINSVSTTLLTTPTDKDFYLTSCSLSVIKDATSQSIVTSIEATPVYINGQTRILSIQGLSLTAQSETISINFTNPILIKRNSNITITNSNATANISCRGAITGYYVENSTA